MDEPPQPPNNNNNSNNNVPLLQDLEHYLERNGIEQQNDDINRPTLDLREYAARIQNERSYKERILQEFLRRDEEAEAKKEAEEEGKSYVFHNSNNSNERKQFLKLCLEGNRTLSIVTSTGVIQNVSLFHLVNQCDTIYTFVSSSQHWSNSNNSDDDNNNNNNSNNNSDRNTSTMTFSLKEFDHASVEEFLLLVQEKKEVNDISPENIIECCRIAHYLQSQLLLEQIADIIKVNVDANNCASICILADQLEMKGLLEASMRYVIESLDKIEKGNVGNTDDNNDDENHNVWDDFPESLKHQVITLRNAARSSIVAGGDRSGKSRVFFSSSNEFLGIFSDTLREHKERLEEAKMRQSEIIEERRRYNASRGRYAAEVDVRGGSVRDAAMKIEKQERRVKTLEMFYKEQKAIFAKDASADGAYKSSFSL